MVYFVVKFMSCSDWYVVDLKWNVNRDGYLDWWNIVFLNLILKVYKISDVVEYE